MNGNMPMSMINSRLNVINWLQRTDNISEISGQTGHSRYFQLIFYDDFELSDRCMDDCIDGSGLVLGLNNAYGLFQWTFMQDGATSHTSKLTMSYLKNPLFMAKYLAHNSRKIRKTD